VRTHGDLPEEVLVTGSLALVFVRSGQAEAARAVVADASKALARMQRPTSHIVLRGLCHLLDAIDALAPGAIGVERERQSATARAALSALQRYARSFPIGEPSYLHFRGLRQRDMGDARRARSSFERGLRAARRMALPAEAALLAADLKR
jgi:hypothetical protein